MSKDELYDLLDDHGIDFDLFREWLDYTQHMQVDEADEWEVARFREVYFGKCTPAEYAEELIRDCYGVPDHLENYINWEDMGRDFEMDGSIYTIGDHLFTEA